MRILNLMLVTAVLGGFSAEAIDITQNDGVSYNDGGQSWSPGTGGAAHTIDGRLDRNLNKVWEDNEVEPASGTGQRWDLEAMVLQGSKLNLIGGYNFKTGESSGPRSYNPGDLFVDADGQLGALPAFPGSNGHINIANFGYEYAVHFDELVDDNSVLTTGNYTVFRLNPGSATVLRSVYYGANWASNPWRFVSGGTPIATGVAGMNMGLSDGQVMSTYSDSASTVDLKGGFHNVLSVDLGWLADEGLADANLHLTYGCGNDNLIGYTKVPDKVPDAGNSAMLLVGAVAVVSGASRRLRR